MFNLLERLKYILYCLYLEKVYILINNIYNYDYKVY